MLKFSRNAIQENTPLAWSRRGSKYTRCNWLRSEANRKTRISIRHVGIYVQVQSSTEKERLYRSRYNKVQLKLFLQKQLSTKPTRQLMRFVPGEVLPYITYTGMCHPTGSWFWSSWFRTGYPFQRRFLEWGIIFRTHENSSFVSSHLKLFKDRLLLKIRFNSLTSKLLYSCCTLCFSEQGQPRPQGFSLNKWVAPPIFEGKALGTRLVQGGRILLRARERWLRHLG